MRTPTPRIPAPLEPRSDPNVLVLRHSFRVITPMHGGGVLSQDCNKPHDPITRIRVASIRGQLRFWWRACGRSGPLLDLAQLHGEESAIWGSTTVPSPTVITVLRQPGAPRSVVVFKRDDRGRYIAPREMTEIAYGAFPLKPSEGSSNQPGTLHDFSADTFTLEIRCRREHAADITLALQAWVLFGGLGGRTRRGFGAIEHAPPPAGDSDETSLHVPDPGAFLERLATRHSLPGVPSLVGATVKLSRTPHKGPETAWKNALGALQKLRQQPGLGRNPGHQSNRPGRSRWPEPDAIRTLLPPPRGKPYAHSPLHNILKFPRAAFGLPIVFHFSTQNEPSDPTLAPRDHERLASPLILRPLREGTVYRALALVLRGTARSLPLVLKPRNVPVQADLTPAEAKHIPPLHGHPNPLDAFLAHFESTAP